MHRSILQRRFIATLATGGALGLGGIAAAQPAVSFTQAFDTAQGQAPANLVLEVVLTPGGGIWEADTLFPNGTSLLDVEINSATGGVIEAETAPAEPGMAAIAAAFAGAGTTWAEAIGVAAEAFPGGWIRSMELEFSEDAGGELVFETTVVDGGTPVVFDISAATGQIIGDDPSGPCVGPVDLLAAADAVQAANPGLPVIEVETAVENGQSVFEVEFADAAAQLVYDVEVRAADGCFDEVEILPDENWSEVAQILAQLPQATVDRAEAVAIAEAQVGGAAFGWELEIVGGQLFHEVDVLGTDGPVTVLVNAIDGSGGGGGGEPGGDVVLVGALDAWAIGQEQTPGGFPLEVELEFTGGVFVWEAELRSGTSLVEHDLNAATGAVLETDIEAAGAESAAIQAAFAAATIPTAEAVAIALGQVPGGFVYEIEREQVAGAARYEIGLVTDADRFEVEIDAASGAVIAVELAGPAHLAPATEGPGMAALATLTPGDANDDDVVDLQDVLEVLAGFGSGNASSDVDGDGDADLQDLLLVLSRFGTVYES